MTDKIRKMKLIAFLLIALASLLQISCSLKKLEESIESKTQLHHSIPEELSLRFAAGYRKVDQNEYYFEAARWISSNRTIEVSTRYTYLLGDYVFGSKKDDLSSVVKSNFEDRVVSVGEEETVKSAEGDRSFISFKLDDAICLFSRRYIRLRSPPDMIDGLVAYTYLGDAEISGYICDYGELPISTEKMRTFMNGISTEHIRL